MSRGTRHGFPDRDDFAVAIKQEYGLAAEMYRSEAGQRASRNGASIFSAVTFAVSFVVGFAAGSVAFGEMGVAAVLCALVIALLAVSSTHIALEWEKVGILRFGKFNRVAGPGLYFTIPVVEYGTLRIDQRVMVTPFGAEETLTEDLVPVNIDAVLLWVVWDAKKACIEVEDYRFAVSLAAQTTLRDAIGRTTIAGVVSRRNQLDQELRRSIEEKVAPWGITVMSVDIRDIRIPSDLQEAMSFEAKTERQKNARLMLMDAERDICDMLIGVGESYHENSEAFQLRKMHLVYDSVKETGGTVVVPSAFSEGFTDSPEDLLKKFVEK